ncbi:hypothetical protein AALB16_10735 [Lachnospiraceae bacterium 62-35]
MNYNELWNEISNSLFTHVKNLINKAPYDKTFKAKVLKKLSDKKYQILYKNAKYTAKYHGLVNTGETVHVCAPKNNWNELFILDGNQHFENINSNCFKRLQREDVSIKNRILEYVNNGVNSGYFYARRANDIPSGLNDNNSLILFYSSPSDTSGIEVVALRKSNFRTGFINRVESTPILKWDSSLQAQTISEFAKCAKIDNIVFLTCFGKIKEISPHIWTDVFMLPDGFKSYSTFYSAATMGPGGAGNGIVRIYPGGNVQIYSTIQTDTAWFSCSFPCAL